MRRFFILLFSIFYLSAFSQKIINGVITDSETKLPIIGATIIVIDTDQGAVSDFDGKFQVTAPQGSKMLSVSYTGYSSQEINILDEDQELNIVLVPDTKLNEVVVIGYGSVKKSDKTGSIVSIKPNKDQVLQYDNFQSFLQGRASGVYVQSNGNELLSPSSIRIRGANSLRGDSEPLYVIDGIIVNSSNEDVKDPLRGGNSYLSGQSGLSGINPQDIESIEILKDASATAIYGSRGANGVILITTKKGKEGKPRFNYTATVKTGKATRLIEMLNPTEFVDYDNEWKKLNGADPTFYKYNDGSIARWGTSAEFMEAKKDSIPRLEQANWYDLFQNSSTTNHRLSVSSGSKKSSYYIAGGFAAAKGIVPGTKLGQGDILFNYSHEVTDRLTLAPRFSATFINNKASKGTDGLSSFNTSLMKQILLSAPLRNLNENNLANDNDDVVDGPEAWLTDYNDDGTEFRSLASMKADYKISSLFTLRVLGGIDYRNKKRQLWVGKKLFRGALVNGEAGISSLNRWRYNIDNTLIFEKNLGKKSKIGGTIGFIMDRATSEQSGFTGTNFAIDDLKYNGISFAQTYLPLDLELGEESLLSYLGRFNYTLDDKYLMTATFRADGSSKFAAGNKFSYFPSVALAWKITNENFMKGNKFFEELKLRIGYGRTGNQGIRPFGTFSRFSGAGNLISDGRGGGQTAILVQNLANTALKWETTDQINIGTDFSIQNGKVEGNIDLYQKTTKDLLQIFNVGPSSGFKNILANQGDLENKGVELGLAARIFDGDFKWKISGNISANSNRILNLGLPPAQYGTQQYSAYVGSQVSGGTAFKVPANIFIEGQPAALFWGYQTNGIIASDAQLAKAPKYQSGLAKLGDLLYVDQNNDGNINDSDLTIIGNPSPDFTYGFGSEFSFKNFGLELFFNGVQGNEIANANLAREDYALGNLNNIRKEAYTAAFRPGSTDATHPRLGYPLQGDFTDRMVEDGSFLRLTYVTLNYKLKNFYGVDDATVFVSGNNLLLLTKYSGFDPEVNSFSFDPTRQGIDLNSFPNQKSFSVGLNINF
jgi:TonB-dependent starch-binding outer membrane protein SusC